MSGISPVVYGETAELQATVEAVFTSESMVVEDRLHELEAQIRALGYEATFGLEIEATAVADPAIRHENVRTFDNVYFYEKIVEFLTGASAAGQPTWEKGAVILPEQNPGPVMVQDSDLSGEIPTRYNLDQDDIIEIQSTPANASTAIERYWQIIQAIGYVMQQHGHKGVILATHVNIALRRRGDDKLMRLWTPEGATLVAAVQHNLNALEALQLHAGMATGFRITEAFPSKHASTAWHELRTEERHPSIGVIDPRIDMLGALSAIEQFACDEVPKVALRNIHECVKYTTIVEPEDRGNGLAYVLSSGTAIWDKVLRKFVLPAAIQPAVGQVNDERRLNELTRIASNGTETSTLANNGATIRRLVGQICIEKYNVRPRRGVTLSNEVLTLLRQLTAVTEKETGVRYRYLPRVEYDSPSLLYQRRRQIKRSAIVRSVLGAVSGYLSSPELVMDLRGELIRAYGEDG